MNPEIEEIDPSLSAGRPGWQDRTHRIGIALVRFLGIFLIAGLGIFLALEAMPEDPVSLRVKNPDPGRIAAIRETLGLNDPLPLRFSRSLSEFVTLDWGTSLISGRPVREEIGRFLPATLELALAGMLFGIVFGTSIVLLAHATGKTWLLRPARGLSALGLTVPIFWIGLLLILLFSVYLNLLPVGGRFDYSHPAPSGTGFLLLDSLLAGDLKAFVITLKHLALPVFTLGLYPAAVVSGTLGARLGERSIEQLVVALRSRGLSPWRIWCWHVLRLVSGPVVTVVGTQAGALLGGAVLTETVYSWPGMGRFLVQAVLNRDVFAIHHGLLLVVVLALVLITFADLVAGRLDYHLGGEQSHGE